jgi:Flp pilus assembly protein TadG
MEMRTSADEGIVMVSRIPVSAARKRKSRGTAIIESVYTLIPMFALIFAMVDCSMMIFRWSTLQNAVREGCRYAITFQTTGGLGQDASVEQVVQNYAMNLVKTTDSPNRIHVNYYTTTNLNTPIGSGGNIPGNIVEVSVQSVPFYWLFPLSGTIANPFYASTTSPVSISVYSSDILGGYPVGVTSVSR